MLKYWTQRLYCNVNKYRRLQKLLYSSKIAEDKTYYLAKILEESQETVDYLYARYPLISKLTSEHLHDIVNNIKNLDMEKEELIKEPILFSFSPLTLMYRFKVLKECGFDKITGYHVVNCLKIIKNMRIEELKASGYIMPTVNVPMKLASYMSRWPASLTTLILSDINQYTLYNLRLTILKRYLQIELNLSDIEFSRGLKTYPNIKLRPLQMINEAVTFLLKVIGISEIKLKSNLYLVHANYENLNKIVYEVKNIAGVDVKEILRMYPKLCVVSSSNIIEIKSILKEYGFDNEAQMKCFNLFTLSPNTIRERLEKAKELPEFQVYQNHPRFLGIIMYKTRAMSRLFHIYKINKKCSSLNLLSGSTKVFQKFVKAPGDHTGKGKDLLHYISQELDNEYSTRDIRKKIKKHPFWIHIPLVHVKLVHKMLSNRFSSKDIFENCPILLYPLNKISEVLKCIIDNESKLPGMFPHNEQIDVEKLNKSQILSLTLYILEKNHYFNGNGVWIHDRYKDNCEINIKQ